MSQLMFCCCLGPATLFKKILWHRCLSVNLAKFLRTPFNTSQLEGIALFQNSQIMFENKLITYRKNLNKVVAIYGRELQLLYFSLKCTDATSNNKVWNFSVLHRRQKTFISKLFWLMILSVFIQLWEHFDTLEFIRLLYCFRQQDFGGVKFN